MPDERPSIEPELASPRADRRQRRRGLWIGDLLSSSVSAVQGHGLRPFTLALAMLAPAAFAATAVGFWFELPGSFLVVALMMSAFALYVAAITPLLVDEEASAQTRSHVALIDKAEARMPSLAVAGGAAGLLVAAGLELRLLPGFLLLGLLALTAPAIVRDGLGPLAGIRRGLRYTQGNALAFATMGALLGAACLGTYAVVAFVLDPLPAFLAEFVAVTASATLAAPIAAHLFVTAFDGRVAGRRMAVRPPAQRHATGVTAASRTAIARTLTGFGGQREQKRPRISFTAERRPQSAQLRYSPDAATMTLRIEQSPGASAPVPDWAQTESSVAPDELHTAV